MAYTLAYYSYDIAVLQSLITPKFYQLFCFFSVFMFTSMTVPFVMTPSCVYRGEVGFFFTPIIGKEKVALSSG